MAAQLRDIAFRYIVFRREENQPEYRKSMRTEYLGLQKATERYLALLKHHEKRDIASDIHLVASVQHQMKNPVDLLRFVGHASTVCGSTPPWLVSLIKCCTVHALTSTHPLGLGKFL